jgi:hypothetical protein
MIYCGNISRNGCFENLGEGTLILKLMFGEQNYENEKWMQVQCVQ